MFTPLVRFSLLLLIVIFGIVCYFNGWTYVLIVLAACSMALLWGYNNVGTVYLALHKLRKGNYEAAEKIIELTRKPEKLSNSRKAYYYYIKAYLAREKDDFSTAKNLFNLALETGLKQEHDQAIAILALADIEVINGKRAKAKELLARMKGLKVKPQLVPQVRKLQEFLG